MDAFSRASNADSGRESMPASERTSSLDGNIFNGAISSLSRDTPLTGADDDIHEECHDKPLRISRTPVLGNKCYQQAYVSHVDNPSTFFLQLPHSEEQFRELHNQMNAYYSNVSTTDRSTSWKSGDYCIVKSNDDHEFYRARIIKLPKIDEVSGLYDVVYLDFGDRGKVTLSDIHRLLPIFAALPAQAVPCSLTKTLPVDGIWSDHLEAMELFEKLVLDQYVDATFYCKSNRDSCWQLAFVDLVVSSSRLDVRQQMKDEHFIREVPNEEIYLELNHLLGPPEYIIYSISYEGEVYDNDDD